MIQDGFLVSVAISGAGGFVGSHVAPLMRQRGIRVVPIDLRLREQFRPLEIRSILHLAARANQTGELGAEAVSEDLYEANLEATKAALSICRVSDCGIVFVSTYLYGFGTDDPASEDSDIVLNNDYQRSKRDSELLCLEFHEATGLPVTIIRPSNLYGAQQKPSFLIPRIIQDVHEHREVVIRNGNARRDFLHVVDFANVLVTAEAHLSGFQVFNVASGRLITLRTLAEIVDSLVQREGVIRVLHEHLSSDLVRPMDTSRVRRDLNWSPSVDLEAGLLALLEN